MSDPDPFVVIILAGGLGKRMNSHLPKVLHQIAGEPMIVHIIKQALLLSPQKILIVVGKYKSIIQETIQSFIQYDNTIEFVFQEEALGTGHAIQCCVHSLSDYSHSKVLVLSGDVPLLKSSTMSQLISEMECPANILVTKIENPTGYGRIVENTNQIEIVEEKDCSPEQRKIQKINGGIYAFQKASILAKYIKMLKNDNSQKEYYLTDVIKFIQEGENTPVKLFELPLEKQVEIFGVNTPEQLRICELEICKNVNPVEK
jgi:UDP-N-acetylglucosamine diphosphorylase/glucosamine-1-phosphate N-acetyltransferase